MLPPVGKFQSDKAHWILNWTVGFIFPFAASDGQPSQPNNVEIVTLKVRKLQPRLTVGALVQW